MFESILTTTDTTISAGSSMLAIAAALILGIAISFCYMYTQKKGTYSKDFVIAIAILPVIVAVVIMLVGSSMARALSLAGAFALVRFRSAPGSAKDIAVVFFAMSVGLAAGLGFIVFAVVVSVIISIALIVLSKTKFGDSRDMAKVLKITIPEDLNYNGVFEDLFEEYTTFYELRNVKTTNMGTLYELTYSVSMKPESEEKSFIDSLRCRNGNLNITLGMVPDKAGTVL